MYQYCHNFFVYDWVTLDIDILLSFYLAWFPFPGSQGPDFYPSLHEFSFNRPFAASYPCGTKLPCWRVKLYNGFDAYIFVSPPFGIKSKTCALGGASLKERDIC